MNFDNMQLSTRHTFCGMCNFPVASKFKHLKEVHGWAQCKFCHNLMGAAFLNDHVHHKHQQPLKRKLDDLYVENRDQKHETDEPKTPPNESDNKTKRPRLTNTPPIELNDDNRNGENDESKTFAENNKLLLNNAPQSPFAAHRKNHIRT